MATEFCPQCGTARVGALRFCRSCAFDYDTLPQREVRPAVDTAMAQVPAEPGPLSVPVSLPAEPNSRRGWLVLGAVIFAAVVAAAAFVGLNNSGVLAPHHDLTGTFELTDTSGINNISGTSSSCQGSGGYSDIGPGTGVTIKNGEGKILATGVLGDGTGGRPTCTFSFALAGVPEAPFYTVEVGHRGALNYSLADLRGRDWSIGFTLGN